VAPTWPHIAVEHSLKVFCAEAGTIVQHVNATPFLNKTSGALEYVLSINLTTAGLFRITPLINGERAGTLDSEDFIVLTVLPGPAAATASKVVQGEAPLQCPRAYDLCIALADHDMIKRHLPLR
jgi:hypothetical protein